jgi:hypothetical protein
MKNGRVWLSVLATTILMMSFGFNTGYAQSVPDLSIWEGKWFKASAVVTGLEFENIGSKYVKPLGGSSPTYLNVRTWASPVLTCDLWLWNVDVDTDIGNWELFLSDFELTYIAGSDLDFVCWFTKTPEIQPAPRPSTWLALMFRITGKLDKFSAISSASLKTQGGFFWELDDRTTEVDAGGLKITGTLTNVTTLCKSPRNAALPPCQQNPL